MTPYIFICKYPPHELPVRELSDKSVVIPPSWVCLTPLISRSKEKGRVSRTPETDYPTIQQHAAKKLTPPPLFIRFGGTGPWEGY